MIAWLVRHAATLRQTIGRLARSPFATLFNVVVIGIAIALPLGLYVVLENLRSLALRFPAEPEISVFMAPDASRTEVTQVEARVRKLADLEQFRFVPKDEALAGMRRSSGLADILDGLPGNPLPDAFVVRLKNASPDRLDAVRDAARAWPRVEHVQVDSDWSRRIEAALTVGRLATALLAALLSTALVAITFNTIRLQILTQRDEIEVSRLIGATNPFIRRPFLYYGSLLGLFGGAAALGIVLAALALLNGALADFARVHALEVRLEALAAGDALAVLGFAAGLGWLGAWLSASRHLWLPATS